MKHLIILCAIFFVIGQFITYLITTFIENTIKAGSSDSLADYEKNEAKAHLSMIFIFWLGIFASCFIVAESHNILLKKINASNAKIEYLEQQLAERDSANTLIISSIDKLNE